MVSDWIVILAVFAASFIGAAIPGVILWLLTKDR